MERTGTGEKLTRRELLKRGVAAGIVLSGLASVGSLLGAGCKSSSISSGQPAESKHLAIGFDGGSWQEFQHRVFTQRFLKAHPDVTVTYDVGTETDRIAKLVAQKGNPVMHLSKFSTPNIQYVESLGLTDKIDVARCPNWKDVHELFRTETWAANIVATFGIAYRTDKISWPIESWWDLWKPELKGRVGLPAFEWMGQQFLVIVNMISGGKPDNIDPGISALKRYVENRPVPISSTDHGMQLFTQGEVWAAPFWDGRVRQLQKSGVPVKFVYPREGACPLGYGLALNANPTSRDLALEYLNLTLEVEPLIEFSRLTQYPPTNLKALENLPPDLEVLRIPKEHMDRMLRVDYLAVEKNKDMYLERWNKEVASGLK